MTSECEHQWRIVYVTEKSQYRVLECMKCQHQEELLSYITYLRAQLAQATAALQMVLAAFSFEEEPSTKPTIQAALGAARAVLAGGDA